MKTLLLRIIPMMALVLAILNHQVPAWTRYQVQLQQHHQEDGQREFRSYNACYATNNDRLEQTPNSLAEDDFIQQGMQRRYNNNRSYHNFSNNNGSRLKRGLANNNCSTYNFLNNNWSFFKYVANNNWSTLKSDLVNNYLYNNNSNFPNNNWSRQVPGMQGRQGALFLRSGMIVLTVTPGYPLCEPTTASLQASGKYKLQAWNNCVRFWPSGFLQVRRRRCGYYPGLEP
ncbi:unnamed protein product [Polarella glacialis]|uniref:Phospholipase B-like n=1 Tax=Polarella glacialis TaxID=89957 RepID=A0A813L7I9_POLGL|nr:unnamed protein product [Polarella glacialis]CAE8722996.1 unnamed protein product [Polarella glacialis]